jgi:hypothetical protein
MGLDCFQMYKKHQSKTVAIAPIAVEILFWIHRSAAKVNLHAAQRNAKKIATDSGNSSLKYLKFYTNYTREIPTFAPSKTAFLNDHGKRFIRKNSEQ